MSDSTPLPSDEVSHDVKRQIILGEFELWKNTREQQVLRAKVQQRIGNAQGVKECEAALLNCEIAINFLLAELAELNK